MKKVKQPHGGAIVHAEKGETANPNGRPPKLMSGVIKSLQEQGYQGAKRAQIVEAFELLFCLDEDKIKEIVADRTQPMIVRVAGKALLGTKGFEIVKDMLDRAHGKPVQALDHTSGGNKMEFSGYEMIKLLAGDAKEGNGEKQGGRPKNEK